MTGEMVGVVVALLVVALLALMELTCAWALRHRRRRTAVTRAHRTGRVEVGPRGDARSPPWPTLRHRDPYATIPIPVIPPRPGAVQRRSGPPGGEQVIGAVYGVDPDGVDTGA